MLGLGKPHPYAYLIADESFSTKEALTARCRAILTATTDGQMVDDDCAEFLFELFKYHDEWDQKASGGVRGISTQMTPHGTRCFVLLNRGGDRIDISFPHAIRLVPNTRTAALLPQALRDFRSAARNAVRAEIYDFRDRALQEDQCCPYTGETLARSTCAVDHAPPKTFDLLLFDFCQGRALNPLRVAVGSDGGTVALFVDQELQAAWQAYHREHSKLRLLSKLGNLQLPKISVPWSALWP